MDGLHQEMQRTNETQEAMESRMMGMEGRGMSMEGRMLSMEQRLERTMKAR